MALIHHIHTLRAKPHHVRERIAFATAAGVTTLVGLVWVATLAATGTFQLAPSAGNTTVAADTTNTSNNSFSQLLGSADAALNGGTTSPSLRIIDDGSQTSLQKQPSANNSDATIIPF